MAAVEVARRYTIDELLKLQDSPLVRKPDGLPDISEWMPPVPPQNARQSSQRTRVEDLANEDGSSSSPSNTRRPSLFDRHMSRSSLTENIILGPPKLSFASANAQSLSRKLDGEPATPGNNSSLLEEDREAQFSPRSFDRFRTNRTSGEKNNDREFRPGFGRRGLRGEDGETWTNVQKQPRRSFGAEDGDRFRRDGDRDTPRERGDRNDRNGHRDRDRGDRERDTVKDRPRGFENYNRDRDRDRPPLKKREESSWLVRDSEGRDGKDSRGDRDFSGRDRDRGERDRDNGYGGRFSRVEKDPEWMHSTVDDKDDSKPARSIEELQRWKERRKAESAAASGTPKKSTEPDQSKPTPEPERIVEEAKSEPASQGLKSPENGVDQFFSMWTQTPSVLGTPAADPLASAGEAIRPAVVGRSSRFTSFFGQDPPISPQKTESPAPSITPAAAPDRTGSAAGHPAKTTNEDKEGFQRILQMLGGVGGKSPSVKSDVAASSVPPAAIRSQDPQVSVAVKERNTEPQVSRQHTDARRTPLSQASPAPSLPFSQLMDSGRHQSPDIGSGKEDPNNDFFLRLMQSSQAQQRQKQLELEAQLHQQQLLQAQQQQKILQQEQQQAQLLAQQEQQKRQEWLVQQQQALAQQQQDREREQREIERRRLQQQQLQLQQAQQQAQQAPAVHLQQQLQQLHLGQHSQTPQQNGQAQPRPGNQHSQLQSQNILNTLQQFQQGPQSQSQLHQHQQSLLQQHLHGPSQSQQNLHGLLQQHPNQLPQLQHLQQNRQAGQTLPSLQQSLQQSNIPSLPNLHTGYGGSSGMPPPPALSSSPHSFSRGPPNNPLSPLFDEGPSGSFNRQRPNQDFNLMARDSIAARDLLAIEQGAFRENGLGRDMGREAGPQRSGGIEHIPGWAGQGLPQHAGPPQQHSQQQQQQTSTQQQQQQSQQPPHQQANGAQNRAVPPPPGFTGSQNGPSRPGPGAQNIPALQGNPSFMGHPSQGPSGMPPPPSLPPFQLGHPGAPGGPPNGPNGPLPGSFPPPPFFNMSGPPPHPNFPLSPFHNDAPVMGMGGPPPFPFPPDVKGLNLPQGMHPPPPNPSSRFFPS